MWEIREQDRELAIERLEAKPSEMRDFTLAISGLGDVWAVEFAQRALPNMPKLEMLKCAPAVAFSWLRRVL